MTATEQGKSLPRRSQQRIRKEAMRARFEEMIADAETVMVASYSGLEVLRMEALRKKAALNSEVHLSVVKNSVARIVLADSANFAPLASELGGQLIYAIGSPAPAVAKLLYEFAAEHKELVVCGGALDGVKLSPVQIGKLAKLPSRQELLAQLAGVLRAPAARLAGVLAAVPGGLARVLTAVRDQKEAAAGPQSG